nr:MULTISPECIES: MDR family MFS transporter [Bacillus]
MLIGAFVTIFNQTLLTTALPKVMADLNIEPATGQWLTTAFMLTNGIMIPLTALLISRIHSRTLFLIAMVSFAIGTLVCSFAETFELLLTGRIIQAIGAGIMMPLMQTIFLLIFPIEKRGAAMGMVGLVIGFGPAIGPTLSGWIVDSWDWHYLFYIVLPIAILDIIFAFFAMKNVVHLTKPKIDVLSIILSTIGFGSLLYGFSSAGNDGWGDVTVVSTIILGIVGIVLFSWRQLTMKNPMLELRVFKSKIFIFTTIIGCILFMAMIGSTMILPLYIQNIHGKSALFSGLVSLPGALVMGIMGPITGRIFDRYGAKWLAFIGTSILVVATIPFLFLTENTSMWTIAIVSALRFLGIGMVMMPLTTAGINSLSRNMLSHGTAVNNTLRQVAGSIGTAILITIMTNVMTSNMPAKALAATNPEGYMSKVIDASLKGINASFLATLIFAIFAFLLTFFVKEKKVSIKQGKMSA